MDARERNRLMNVYRKEIAGQVGSPFRESEYVELRLKGVSPEKALEIVKSKTRDRK